MHIASSGLQVTELDSDNGSHIELDLRGDRSLTEVARQFDGKHVEVEGNPAKGRSRFTLVVEKLSSKPPTPKRKP